MGADPGPKKESWVTFRCKENQESRNNEIRKRSTKTLEQDVEAKMRQAQGKQRPGLEKAETHGNIGTTDLEMGRNMAEARPNFEKGNQAEGKDGQTETEIQGARQRHDLAHGKLALPPHPLTCGRSLHPMPSRASSRMGSCIGRQLREDGEQVWM